MHINFPWKFHQNVFTLTITFIVFNMSTEFVLIYRPHPVQYSHYIRCCRHVQNIFTPYSGLLLFTIVTLCFCDNIPTKKFIFFFFGGGREIEGEGGEGGGREGGRGIIYVCIWVHYTCMEMNRNIRIQISSLEKSRRSQFAIVSLLKTVSNVFAGFTLHGFKGKISQ